MHMNAFDPLQRDEDYYRAAFFNELAKDGEIAPARPRGVTPRNRRASKDRN